MARVKQLNDYAKYSSPSRKGPYYFFFKNSGLQNQSVLFIQKGLDGRREVLLDPNAWGETTRLGAFVPSADAKYAVYGMQENGADWSTYKVIDLATKKTLPDTLKWIKVSGVAWQGHGFYYSRYPEPAKGKDRAGINEDHRVYFHQVGTPQSQDRQIYQDAGNPQRFNTVDTTEDERFALLSVSDRGKGKDGNALFARDLSRGQREFNPVIKDITNDSFGVVDNVGDTLLVETNHGAPNGRVVLVDPRHPEEANWKSVLPERPEPLESVSTAGGKLFATYLKDVTTRAYVFSLDGTLENEIELPGLGSAAGFAGNRDDTFVFYTFNSLNVPPTIYRYEIATKKSTVFRQPEIPGYNPGDYETESAFYPSKDGTKIPIFLVHKKGLKLDGTNPTLLYGYGGFNIVQSPTFSAARLALLEQGFVYANANLRGGGEYGEEWHKQGMKLKKQNVFDDFIAAAEWLIAQKYTSSDRLAVQGGSNGGLLIGAVINQRPELFKVAIPQVGVMDMLRFQKFTIGFNWIADYGASDSDNADEFKALYAYSPLHNIKAGAEVSGDADHDVGPRRPRRPGPLIQVRGDAAGEGQPRHADPDPDRHALGSRRQQPDQGARDERRHLYVHHVQHGADAEGGDPRVAVRASAPRRRRLRWSIRDRRHGQLRRRPPRVPAARRHRHRASPVNTTRPPRLAPAGSAESAPSDRQATRAARRRRHR